MSQTIRKEHIEESPKETIRTLNGEIGYISFLLASSSLSKMTNPDSPSASETAKNYATMLSASALLRKSEAPITMEFEVEEEQRIYVEVDPELIDLLTWDNHVVDIYDPSRRVRVRVKNGKPRLTIKIPLLPLIASKIKSCAQLEFKTDDNESINILYAFLLQIANEPGSKIIKKKGKKIKLENGKDVWLNQDVSGNLWIEFDGEENIIPHLSDGIFYIKHAKSGVGMYGLNLYNKKSFEKIMMDNFSKTSRSSNGIYDTSVSHLKENKSLPPEVVKKETSVSLKKTIRYIWDSSVLRLSSVDDVQYFVSKIVSLVSDETEIKTKDEETANYRTWEVPYGDKILPQDIPNAMRHFYEELFQKINDVRAGIIDPIQLSSWVEFEFDRKIHPLKDGCGRSAKMISSFLLVKFNHVIPIHSSRDEYYSAMNAGYEAFSKYYVEAINRGTIDLLGWNE